MTLTTMIALATLLAAPAPQSDPVAVVSEFHAALRQADEAVALELMSPDVTIFEAGGAEMSRQEYASHHLSGDIRFAAATTREVVEQRQIVDAGLAIVLSRTRTTGVFGDREIDSSGVETMVLRHGPEGWKITHVHWSSRSASR